MATPVILDTDIGFDVDDVWALVFLLQCPELDVKLITTTTGDTWYRAAIVAKLLTIAGRTDIPIGIGIPLDYSAPTHEAWLGDFQLSEYAGVVIEDGIGALCKTIHDSHEPVSLIGIGPLPNIAAALSRSPNITGNARFIGMHGSLRRGYLGAPKPMREYNVKQHALSARAVFQASWEKIITPLDTCGIIALTGERFQQVKQSQNALTQAALENHFGWAEAVRDWPLLQQLDMRQQSSILYDAVAVYLAFSDAFLEMESLPIVVTSDGKTLIDPAGKLVSCATEWRDQEAFLDLLVARLL
ncbi:nucleoside hydrolase [Pseudomonadales bacterium]|nr:nucleoside hydrolase [Pseudomonadales bacterium]